MLLRRCANLPVESFTVGGLSWFSDLTIADPYFALPLLASITLYGSMKLNSAEFGAASKMKFLIFKSILTKFL